METGKENGQHERDISRESQYAGLGQDWSWLTSLLPCEMAQNGDEFRGLSLCPKGSQWLMTVRVTLDGIPSVAFTMAGSASACVSSFRKRWEGETLQVFPDRYVKIDKSVGGGV